jgi:hypothetical protein
MPTNRWVTTKRNGSSYPKDSTPAVVVKVKVLEVDRQGRVRLSIKEANAPTEAAAAPAAVAVEEPAAE